MKKGKYIYRVDYKATVQAIPDGEGREFTTRGRDYAALHNACSSLRRIGKPVWFIPIESNRAVVKRTVNKFDRPAVVKPGEYAQIKDYNDTVLAIYPGEEHELTTEGRDYNSLQNACARLRAQGIEVRAVRSKTQKDTIIIKRLS